MGGIQGPHKEKPLYWARLGGLVRRVSPEPRSSSRPQLPFLSCSLSTGPACRPSYRPPRRSRPRPRPLPSSDSMKVISQLGVSLRTMAWNRSLKLRRGELLLVPR